MISGIHPPWDSQAEEFHFGKAVLPGYGITVSHQDTNLCASHSCFQVKLHGKRLCGELLQGYIDQEPFYIHEDGMTAKWYLYRDSKFLQSFTQVGNLFYPGIQVIELSPFIQSLGKCIHIPSAHAAVCDKSFEHDVVSRGFPEYLFITEPDESSHIDNGIFFTAHGHAISYGKHFSDNLLYRFIPVLLFPGFYKISIFSKPGSIVKEQSAVFFSNPVNLFQVLHAHRLSP